MPWWVPLVFIYCLFIGYRMSKPTTGSVYLLMAPFILTSLALMLLFSMATLLSFIAFSILGSLWGHSEKISFHQKTITIPGSWIPMFLIMTLFLTKFTLGWLKALCPHIAQQYNIIGLLIQISIAGAYLGRYVNFLYRYGQQRHE